MKLGELEQLIAKRKKSKQTLDYMEKEFESLQRDIEEYSESVVVTHIGFTSPVERIDFGFGNAPDIPATQLVDIIGGCIKTLRQWVAHVDDDLKGIVEFEDKITDDEKQDKKPAKSPNDRPGIVVTILDKWLEYLYEDEKDITPKKKVEVLNRELDLLEELIKHNNFSFTEQGGDDKYGNKIWAYDVKTISMGNPKSVVICDESGTALRKVKIQKRKLYELYTSR